MSVKDYFNGEITDEEAKDIFGDKYYDLKGAKIMREEIDECDDLYMEDKNLEP